MPISEADVNIETRPRNQQKQGDSGIGIASVSRSRRRWQYRWQSASLYAAANSRSPNIKVDEMKPKLVNADNYAQAAADSLGTKLAQNPAYRNNLLSH